MDLIPLKTQALFAPTEEWAEEARQMRQWLRDRQALLRPVGTVVVHAAAPSDGEGEG